MKRFSSVESALDFIEKRLKKETKEKFTLKVSSERLTKVSNKYATRRAK